MKKTNLYKDITTGDIYTLQEMKNAYAVANDCDLPIDDYDMESVIFKNLSCVGGNIEIINDKILDFCNDFSDFMEADRGMEQEEIDVCTKENYYGIIIGDDDIIESIFDNIEDYNEELTNRFYSILKEV